MSLFMATTSRSKAGSPTCWQQTSEGAMVCSLSFETNPSAVGLAPGRRHFFRVSAAKRAPHERALSA